MKIRLPFSDHLPPFYKTASSSLLLFAVVATGCARSVSGVTQIASTNTPIQSSDGAKPSTPTWEALDMDGMISKGRFANRPVLKIDKIKKELVLRLPLVANPYLDGGVISANLAKFANSKLELGPSADGGSEVTLRISLANLIRTKSSSSASAVVITLPNGQPLLGITESPLVSETVDLKARVTMSATVYLGKNIMAVYVNSTINPLVAMSFPITNADHSREWGNFVSVPATIGPVPGTIKNKNGGYFISARLPIDISQVIESAL